MLLYNPLKLTVSGTPTPFFKATLPLPPSINASYKIVRVASKKDPGATPRIVQRLGATAQLEAFKIEAVYALKTAQIDKAILSAIHASKFKTPLTAHYTFYFPSLWKKDVDGGVKAVQDACFKYLQLNDNLVTFQSAAKAVDAENPRVEVELSCFVL